MKKMKKRIQVAHMDKVLMKIENVYNVLKLQGLMNVHHVKIRNAINVMMGIN